MISQLLEQNAKRANQIQNYSFQNNIIKNFKIVWENQVPYKENTMLWNKSNNDKKCELIKREAILCPIWVLSLNM